MTNEREFEKFEFEPDYDFGDLVRVAGYYPQIYRIIGMRCESYFYPDEEWSELIYELSDVYTAGWLEADEKDLVLVAEEENADEYLSTIGQATIDLTDIPSADEFDITDLIVGLDWAKGEERIMFGKQPKEPRKPTARELSAQEAERRKQARKDKAKRVDELLDSKNDFKALYEAFGDSEYLKKQTEIDAELAEEMAKGDDE